MRGRIGADMIPNCISRLETDFVKFAWDIEGNRIENNLLFIGFRAGPKSEIWNGVHEMAHLIEIDDIRCTRPNWGLGFTGSAIQYIAGKRYIEPTTYRATERELQVVGIQIAIMQDYDIFKESELNSGIEAIIDWMPDSLIWRIAHNGRTAGIKAAKQKALEHSKLWIDGKWCTEWHRKCEIVCTRFRK